MSAYCSIAVLLLAFGLRVHHLDFQASLSDDALGLTLARLHPLSVFSITSSEPFPPTFYVILSVWTRLAGDSEFAGRFLSLVFSMLAVAVLFATGRALVGQPAGLIAAFLLAVDPFDIFFAQEVRMYTMVVLFSLVSAYLAYNLLRQHHERWLLYALASIAAAMTHAFALLVLFAQDAAALVSGPRAWRWLRTWA
ncbi:MAG: glycosyltransferase family 39 protein, partial [Chloroflexota bacterium]